MKKFFIVSGIVVIVLVSLVIGKDWAIRSAITAVVSRITGTPVRIDGFSLDLLSSTMRVSGFKMYNPAGFPEGILLSCPKINVIYDPASLFKPKRHLLLVDIESNEIGIAKNKAGKLNVDSLKFVGQPRSAPAIPMQIDLVTLRIGKIVFKDYSGGTEPGVRVYDVGSRNSYKGISSLQQMVALMLAEPLKAAAIKNARILGLDIFSGIAVMPVAIIATYIGKDSVYQLIDVDFERLYKTSLEVLRRMGSVTQYDAPRGVIKANISGTMVVLILTRAPHNKTEMTVAAREFLFARLDIAGGVLYQILDKLQ